jgi:hypothetical protein
MTRSPRVHAERILLASLLMKCPSRRPSTWSQLALDLKSPEARVKEEIPDAKWWGTQE